MLRPPRGCRTCSLPRRVLCCPPQCVTTAAGRLGDFEGTVAQLLDIVAQQDEALGRLEQQAQQASASEGGGVLGIMAPDLTKRPLSQPQSRIGSVATGGGGLVGSSTSRLLALASGGGGGGAGGFSSIVAAAVAAEAAAGGGSRPGTPNSSVKLGSSGTTPLQGSGKAGRLAAAAAAAAASGSTGSASGEALGSFGARVSVMCGITGSLVYNIQAHTNGPKRRLSLGLTFCCHPPYPNVRLANPVPKEGGHARALRCPPTPPRPPPSRLCSRRPPSRPPPEGSWACRRLRGHGVY